VIALPESFKEEMTSLIGKRLFVGEQKVESVSEAAAILIGYI